MVMTMKKEDYIFKVARKHTQNGTQKQTDEITCIVDAYYLSSKNKTLRSNAQNQLVA